MSREVVLELPKWHEKQKTIYESSASEILVAGDTRAGKSFFIRKAYIIYCSRIPGLQTDIFRLHYDDVVKENMKDQTGFPVLLDAWAKAGMCKITADEVSFWNGSRIFLKHCSDDVVMYKNQGIPMHVRTFGEATQIAEHRMRALAGWVTMSEDMKNKVPDEWKGQFPKIFYATNPFGPSAGYFRRNFVDKRPPMTIEKVGAFNRQYIPVFVDENPSENADDTRARIAESFPDKAKQDALISTDRSGISNWHAGLGDFFPEWDYDRHVVDDFSPPGHWFRFRGFDWGTAEPFAVLWFAVSDGEPFKDSEGKTRWFPRGALIVYNEWYGCDPENPAKGCRMRNEDMAEGIIARSEYSFRQVPTLTDSLPFQDRGGETIAMVFAKNGCPLTLGDTSRVPGWSQVRSRLIGKQIDTNSEIKTPMIFFTKSCKYCADYVPQLQRHPSEKKKEDAVEHGEATHICDTIRLGSMAHTIIKDVMHPTQARIEKTLKAMKPTMQKITQKMGASFFR